jgi:serine/threonine protein kinase
VRPIVGRFEIDGPVPPIGVSARFVACDPSSGTFVVLQFLADAEGEGAWRSRAVARTCASLSHPNVVPVTEVLEHAGSVVLVMDHVCAETLRAWVERRSRSVSDLVRAHLGAAAGLEAAHAAGLAHRGFAADRAVRDRNGRVRVLAADLVHSRGRAGVRRDLDAFCDALRGSLLLTSVGGAYADRVHEVLERWRLLAHHDPLHAPPGLRGAGMAELRADLRRALLVTPRVAAACRTRT